MPVIEYVVIGILFGITFTNPVVFGGVILIVWELGGVSSSSTVTVKGGDPTDISTITSTSNPWFTTGIFVVKLFTTGVGLIVRVVLVDISLQGAIPKTS